MNRRTSDDTADEGVARDGRDGSTIDAVDRIERVDGRGRDDAGRTRHCHAARRDVDARGVCRARCSCRERGDGEGRGGVVEHLPPSTSSTPPRKCRPELGVERQR